MGVAACRKGAGALALQVGLAAVLLLSPGVARGADGFEPDDTPALAPLVPGDGVFSEHSFDPAGDVDWLKFRATAGKRYLVTTAGESDTFLELYGTDGSELLEQDDDSGPGRNASIAWECWYTGTYFVRISHFSAAGTGDYQISVAESGGLAGTISFSGAGARPQYVEVRIFNAVTGEPLDGTWTSSHETWTYEVNGLLPAAYLVRFETDSGDFLGEWWEDGQDAYTATTVTVAAGTTTWDISPVLDLGGSISGTIGFAGSGAPPASVAVSLHPVLPDLPYREVYADSAGGWAYRFGGLPKGSYRLKFTVENDGPCAFHGGEWWNDRPDEGAATPVIVVPGFDVEGVDPTLDVRYGVISGTVSFAPGGVIPGEVGVSVYDASSGEFIDGTYTADWKGWAYAVCGLAQGTYALEFKPYDGSYGGEWWEDSPSMEAATAVEVVPGLAAAGVSPTLDVLAGISGTVLFLPGGVLPYAVRVTVHAAEDGEYVDSTFADQGGGWRYSFERLPPGAYKLEFDPYDGDYLPEWWDNATDIAVAAELVLPRGRQLPDVSPALSTTADDPRLFFDSFAHGSATQNPEWSRIAGQWHIDAKKRYASLSLDAVNLSLVKRFAPPELHLGAGSIASRVALTGRAAGTPNARIVFSWQGAGKYRFVELTGDRVAIGQVGTVGGMPGGVKAKAPIAPVAMGVLLPIRVDLRPNGVVVVYVRGSPVLRHRFPAAVPGGVGVGAVRAGSVFDSFTVSDTGDLP